MLAVLSSVADAWIARRARPNVEALAAVAGQVPAVVVTGASRGIGLALAHRFAKAGHAIVLIARNAAELDAAADLVARTFKVRAVALALDITRPDAPERIEAAVAAAGLYADILVNNAGVGLSGAFDSQGADEIEAMLAINVAALTRLMRHMLPKLRARARGGILNVASLGGLVPGPNQAAYYASKAYVVSLTEAVAHEMAGTGVRIAAVAPGPVATGFHRAMRAERSVYGLVIPAAAPEAVAASAYRGYRLGRRVIVPGVLGTFASLAVKLAPHALTVPIVGVLLGKMPSWAPPDRTPPQL